MCQISVEEELQKWVVYFFIVVNKTNLFLAKKLENIAEEKHKIRKYKLQMYLYQFSVLIVQSTIVIT